MYLYNFFPRARITEIKNENIWNDFIIERFPLSNAQFFAQSNDDLYSFLIAAGGRRIRHGTELRDSGRTEHQAYAGIARSLPAQSPGKQRVLRPP